MRVQSLWNKASYKTKIFTFILFMSIVPVLLLGMFSSFVAAKMVQQEVDHNHQIILRQIQYQIDSFLQGLEKTSLQLASNITIEKSVVKSPSEDLALIFDAIDTMQWQRGLSDIQYDISLIYNRFHKVYSTRYGYINDTEFPYQDLVRKVGTQYNSSVVIPPNSNPGQKELLVLRAVPTFFADSADGILVIHVDNSKLTALFDRVQLGERRKLLVIDDKGAIVMSQNQEELGNRITPSSELYEFWKLQESSSSELSLRGIPYSMSVQKSAFNNWTYMAMTPIGELTHKASQIQYFAWGLVLLLSFLWIVFSLIGSNRLYFPIQRLLFQFTGESKSNTTLHKDGIQALDSLIRQMVNTNDHLKSELNQRLPYLKETVLQQLIRGEMSDQEIHKKTEHYGLPLKGSWFYVCLVDVDRFADFKQSYRENDRSLMLYALRKMVEEICEDEFSCMTATPVPGQVAVIIGVDKAGGATDEQVAAVAEQCRAKVQQHFRFTVTVSVSTNCRGYRGISDAYQEAAGMLGYRLLLGHNVVISPTSINPAVQQSGQSLLKWQKQIVTSIAKEDLAEAKQHLDQMISVIPQYAHNSETVLGLFAYLLGEMDVLLQEWGQSPEDYYEIDRYKQLYEMTSLQEVKLFFESTVFPAAIKALKESNLPKQKKMIQQVLFYIHEHYETDLSLQQLADRFHTSPSQLSRTFKEETGEVFGDYLLHYRMEKAKEWLIHTEMPIKDIAERLRYTNVQNFNRIFKQVTNVPPGQYRKQYREEDNRQIL